MVSPWNYIINWSHLLLLTGVKVRFVHTTNQHVTCLLFFISLYKTKEVRGDLAISSVKWREDFKAGESNRLHTPFGFVYLFIISQQFRVISHHNYLLSTRWNHNLSSITSFRSMTMLYGINNIPWNIPHIQIEVSWRTTNIICVKIVKRLKMLGILIMRLIGLFKWELGRWRRRWQGKVKLFESWQG